MNRTPVLKMKIEYPSEAWEHMELINKCIKQEHQYPALALIYHHPAGEARPFRTYVKANGTQGRYCPAGQKLKRMGAKPGIPDLHLPVARGCYHSLYIEMKSCDPNDKTTKEQDEWIDALRKEGHCVVVCHGWQAAWTILVWYLSLGSAPACPCFDDPLRKELLDAA